MKGLVLAPTLLLPLISVFRLIAGQPYEALDAGDVFVATITRVEDKDASNSHPPRVWLKVHEVLRGEAYVARSPAVWSPAFHGIDWGDGGRELMRWNAAPLKGPKVGEKFILGGKSLKIAPERDAPAYNLFAFVRIPYSDEARAKAIATLANLDEARHQCAAQQSVKAKERELRRREWRTAIDETVIDKRTQQADAVAIGQIVSGSTFEIEALLKGQPRMSASGKYFVTLPREGFDPRIADLVYERPRCLLFLSEENLIASVTDIHARIVDPYEGIVLADVVAIAAVKASLQKRPAPKSRPVLVISALDTADADPLAKAARARFAVVISQQLSAHSPNSVIHVRNSIPHAEFLVMIDRGPYRRVVALQIKHEAAVTLYEAVWPEKGPHEQIQALIKTLVETVN